MNIFKVNEKVGLRSNSRAVGVVTGLLPGGFQYYVRWNDWFTTLERREDLQSAECHLGITVRIEFRNGLWLAACQA